MVLTLEEQSRPDPKCQGEFRQWTIPTGTAAYNCVHTASDSENVLEAGAGHNSTVISSPTQSRHPLTISTRDTFALGGICHVPDHPLQLKEDLHNQTKECLRFAAPFGLNMFAASVRIARTGQLCAPFVGHIGTRIWAGPVDH